MRSRKDDEDSCDIGQSRPAGCNSDADPGPDIYRPVRVGLSDANAAQPAFGSCHSQGRGADRYRLGRGPWAGLSATWELFAVSSQARSKAEYLMRPDLGRRLGEHAQAEVARRCAAGADLQVVIGDGLSVAAVIRQVPHLLPLLQAGAEKRGWRFGRPFAVRYCRVGVLNDIGELLAPVVLVLLIGERPGLLTAESLSAYMAYRPRGGHTDAERNLISNIHARGVAVEEAAERILRLADRMRRAQLSGVAVKEELGGLAQNATPLLADE